MKKHEFGVRFEYPAEQDSFYDTMTNEAYFFGDDHDAGTIIKALNHEAIHFLVHIIAGKRATFKFDRISNNVEKWDKVAYRILY